jgi:hypothetical protein
VSEPRKVLKKTLLAHFVLLQQIYHWDIGGDFIEDARGYSIQIKV